MKTQTYITHEIVAGDTLSKLAAKYYGDSQRYPEIASANALRSPYTVYIGQKILIPMVADDPLREVTVTAKRVPDYPPMPVPILEELNVTAPRFNPWLLAGIFAGLIWATKKGR